jgi:uncharacterized protein YraI
MREREVCGAPSNRYTAVDVLRIFWGRTIDMSHEISRRALGALACLALAAWTQGTWAFPATVTDLVHLRSGPSVEYPSVALLGRGSTVEVFGCEEGYGWCDAQIGKQRGWVAADYLMARGPSGPVVIAGNGVVLGLAVTPFIFNTYWGAYYRGMPWYARRDYYYGYWNRYPHGRPPPPPMYRPPPPIYRPPPPPRPPPRPTPYPRPPSGGKPPPQGGRPPGSGAAGPQPRPATLPTAQPQVQPQPR